MEIKTLEQIKEEYAKQVCYDSWQEMYLECLHTGIDAHVDEVATRYAQQFQVPTDLITTEISVMQERIAELEDMLSHCHSLMEDASKFYKSIALNRAIKEAESLINKGK